MIIAGARLIDVDEFLWIAIYQRKPTARDLHHYAVTPLEGMKRILHSERYERYFAGRKLMWPDVLNQSGDSTALAGCPFVLASLCDPKRCRCGDAY